jgi:transcriptional regulator GlxA family with amidase domain
MAAELARAPFSVPNSELFSRLFSSLFQIPPDRTPETHRVIDQLVILLFSEFLRLAELGHPLSRPDEPVRKAVAHMEAHLEEEDCLGGACRAAGLSHNALIYHFRRKFALSPGRYLWKLRTERGIAMLSQTGLTIGEIAFKSGFKNPFHFSRLVKSLRGVPPREVRNRAWA